MKRILSTLAGFSVLAVSLVASAAPRYEGRFGAPHAGYARSVVPATYARPAFRTAYASPAYHPSYARPVFHTAFARPAARFDYGHAHARAHNFAIGLHGLYARAHSARFLTVGQRLWLPRLYDLTLAAQR